MTLFGDHRSRTLLFVAYCAAVALLWTGQATAQSRVKNTPTTALAEQVLHDLVSTPFGKAIGPLPWEFFLIDSYRIDTSSDGAGKIFVTTGMATWYLGKARGLWAAELGHEMAHALILHPAAWPAFQTELDNANRAAHQEALRRPLLGHGRESAIFNVNDRKQREYAADYIALMLMAEAGYHPEYALTLDRRMRGSLLDAPKAVAFLSSHPRWEDRARRSGQDLDAARSIFNSCWPDSTQSPGGVAPPLGSLGNVRVTPSADGRELVIQAPFNVTKAEGASLRVTAVFLDGRVLVPTNVPEFRSPDGFLELNNSFRGTASDLREVTFHLPITALLAAQPRLRLVVFLLAGDLVLDVRYMPFQVRS